MIFPEILLNLKLEVAFNEQFYVPHTIYRYILWLILDLLTMNFRRKQWLYNGQAWYLFLSIAKAYFFFCKTWLHNVQTTCLNLYVQCYVVALHNFCMAGLCEYYKNQKLKNYWFSRPNWQLHCKECVFVFCPLRRYILLFLAEFVFAMCRQYVRRMLHCSVV